MNSEQVKNYVMLGGAALVGIILLVFLFRKARGTLLLLLLAGGLASYIYFVEQKTLTTREINEQRGRVVNLERGGYNAITIKNAEAKIELKKHDDGQWYIEEP